MAAANESQGLKIAVAAFITLTVILTVSSYFLYSNGASAEARRESAEDLAATKTKAAALAVKDLEDVRNKVGVKAAEIEPVKEEINTHFKKIDERLNALLEEVNAAVAKAQQSGAQGPELEDAKQNVQKAVSSIRAEPNKTYMSTIDRMSELMDSLSLLTTELSLNYITVRRSLESATGAARQQIDVQTKAATDSHADVLAETKTEDERSMLLTKVDQLQTDNDKRGLEITALKTQLSRQELDFQAQRETLRSILVEQRDKLERSKDTILDHPDGFVTYVDYETHEVLVSVNRRMGAQPQMKMTIFDARSPGIPTEKPKGSIELIAVREKDSSARIIKTINPIDPIRVGDIVYSAAWSPNQPTRFALVGKMDVNRDSRDDREELKRMIREAGGIVEFDLPPPDLGKESGVMSPRIDWYVIDVRPPIRENFSHQSTASLSSQAALEKRVGEVTKEARLNGIRPMTIEKLLAYLGYDMNAAIVGRAEAVDPNAMRRFTAKRHMIDTQAKPAAPAVKAEPKATDDAAEPAAEMKKEEPADDDQPKAKAKTSKKGAAKKKAADDAEGGDADPK